MSISHARMLSNIDVVDRDIARHRHERRIVLVRPRERRELDAVPVMLLMSMS